MLPNFRSEFIVTPVLLPEVVTWCALHNIVIAPGCNTPTEAYTAYKFGAPVQKVNIPCQSHLKLMRNAW